MTLSSWARHGGWARRIIAVLRSMQFALTNGIVVEPKTPFFIVGSGRSGTTLMRRLLIEQTGAVIPPENYALGQSDRLIRHARRKWDGCVRQVLRNLTVKRSQWNTFALDESVLRDTLAAVGTEHRTIPNLWHVFHAIYAARVGKPSIMQWGDKTPINAFRLDRLHNFFQPQNTW